MSNLSIDPAATATIARQLRNRAEGIVVECDGTEAKISTVAGNSDAGDDYWADGQLISIQVGKHRVVGLLHKVENDEESWDPEALNPITLYVE